jgi:hypothetical protein
VGACYHAASVNLLALGIGGDGGVSGARSLVRDRRGPLEPGLTPRTSR